MVHIMGFTLNIMMLGERCCGCGACAAICPKEALSMEPDDLGFIHPVSNGNECVGCMACDRVCPVLNKNENDLIRDAWWAQAKDRQLLDQSSSGGIFGLLATRVVSNGGIVCGAAWSNGCRSVRHVLAKTEDEAVLLRRSKYVQSTIDRSVYAGLRDAIKRGKQTLFVGTACQVSAVRKYLGNLADSPLFLSVDIVCHGVPSPKLWEMWIDYLSAKCGTDIEFVNFRCKSTGWRDFSIAYSSAAHKVRETYFTADWYYESFQANASLRGSCLKCPAKRSCGSDLTIADFWGFQDLHPEFNYQDGVSAVLCNTNKGVEAFASLSPLEKGHSTFDEILRQNRSLQDPSSPYAERDAFLSEVREGRAMQTIIKRWKFGLTLRGRIHHLLARVKHRIIPRFRIIVRRLSGVASE